MYKFIVFTLLLTGCLGTDVAVPEHKAPPTLEETGPETIRDPSHGGPYGCDLASWDDYDTCCVAMVCGGDLPDECVPPAGQCWEFACPLRDGGFATPGLCNP